MGKEGRGGGGGGIKKEGREKGEGEEGVGGRVEVRMKEKG